MDWPLQIPRCQHDQCGIILTENETKIYKKAAKERGCVEELKWSY